jgi:uncharacterized protein (UPF0335 family)
LEKALETWVTRQLRSLFVTIGAIERGLNETVEDVDDVFADLRHVCSFDKPLGI